MLHNKTDEPIKFLTAAAPLQQRIIDNQKDHEAHYLLGMHYMKYELHSLARDEFDTAIQLTGRIAEYYLARGNAFIFLGDHTSATLDYSMASTLKPDDRKAYLCIATLYTNRSLPTLAIDGYTKMIALNNQDIEAYLKRADCHYTAYNYLAAFADWCNVLDIEPTNQTAQDRLFVYLSRTDDSDIFTGLNKDALLKNILLLPNEKQIPLLQQCHLPSSPLGRIVYAARSFFQCTDKAGVAREVLTRLTELNAVPSQDKPAEPAASSTSWFRWR